MNDNWARATFAADYLVALGLTAEAVPCAGIEKPCVRISYTSEEYAVSLWIRYHAEFTSAGWWLSYMRNGLVTEWLRTRVTYEIKAGMSGYYITLVEMGELLLRVKSVLPGKRLI
jgi:hypothetical protein